MEPTTTLTIAGMTCGHCEAAVERALKAVPAVSEVHVDREAGHARVVGSATIGTLIAAVEDAGFDAAAA
jgi:copper chaperone CopZ